MKLLSEYVSDHRQAQIFYRSDYYDFAVVLTTGLNKQAHYFDSESQAEDFAEDWVLQSTKE
jgi:hypothetical protein